MSKCRSMSPRSDSLLKMEFNRVKSSLFLTENKMRNVHRERLHRRGVMTTTDVDSDGDIPPPTKERRTRQNPARGTSVRTIAKTSSKGSIARW